MISVESVCSVCKTREGQIRHGKKEYCVGCHVEKFGATLCMPDGSISSKLNKDVEAILKSVNHDAQIS